MTSTLSLNEALLVALVERGGVDGTNVIDLMRNAQTVLRSATAHSLDWQMREDDVDDILMTASLNGRRDIFAS